MLPNPLAINKHLYIDRTPTWAVRFLYSFGIISWLLVLYGFSGMFSIDPFYQWFVLPILLLVTTYHLLSFGVNLLYRRFNLNKHSHLVKEYWSTKTLSSVDIFLPIAGENFDILRNTWIHVSKIQYENKKIFILDDSSEETEEHKRLAEELGFTYIERPNKGEMKKAGNIKYAFERTHGDFIVIFDADFAPHPQFIIETLPYMNDQKIGIVQTPQYFDTSKYAYEHAHLAYAAAFQEEFFYRIIQVAKDRLNAAICCGSNAVYRRKALETIGGPRQVTASEDSRTGFALLSKGWITRYIPVILAVGVCPNNVYAYFHQQHRWCRGRSELILSNEFRTSSVSLVKKLCNISGFLSFLLRPFEILLTFQLFWMLFLYNDTIAIDNSIIFQLYLIFSFFMLPLFHIARFRKEVLLASTIQAYASMHSIISVFMGKTVSWIPTNVKHTSISPAFEQTIRIVTIYVITYWLLTLVAFRTGDIHLFNINYFSIQFWMLWNLVLSSMLLFQLVKAKRQMTKKKSILSNFINESNITFNTAPAYQVVFFSFLFGFLIGIPSFMYVNHNIEKHGAKTTTLANHIVQKTTPAYRSTHKVKLATTHTSTRKTVAKNQIKKTKKEYGGWYWHEELEKAKRWMGTDSEGDDIWSDEAEYKPH